MVNEGGGRVNILGYRIGDILRQVRKFWMNGITFFPVIRVGYLLHRIILENGKKTLDHLFATTAIALHGLLCPDLSVYKLMYLRVSSMIWLNLACSRLGSRESTLVLCVFSWMENVPVRWCSWATPLREIRCLDWGSRWHGPSFCFFCPDYLRFATRSHSNCNLDKCVKLPLV